jgi:hypothetical protein
MTADRVTGWPLHLLRVRFTAAADADLNVLVVVIVGRKPDPE